MIALTRLEDRARAFTRSARSRGARVMIPSVVVAETFRGGKGRTAAVEHVFSTVDDIVPATEATARRAGTLLAQTSSRETIDAIVVATALEFGEADILTGDATDLRALTPRGSGVEIHAV